MDVKIAVALEDLARVPESVRGLLLSGRLDLENPIHHVGEPRAEPVPAVEFTCDALEAAMAVDVMRGWDAKVDDEPTRAYVRALRPGAAWRKVPGHLQLTVIVNGQPVLNRAALVVPEDSLEDAREAAVVVPVKRGVSAATRPG